MMENQTTTKPSRARKPKAEKTVEVQEVQQAVTPNTLEILSAMYGVDGNRISITPVPGKKLTNKMAGSDPAPKVKKTAVVRASVNGKEVEKTFAEGEVISF